MWMALKTIMEKALDRLSQQLLEYLPSLLAGLIIFVGFYLFAVILRWILRKIFKGLVIDRFLLRSGLASLLHLPQHAKSAQMVPEFTFWLVLGTGGLTALDALDIQWTHALVESVVRFLPNLAVACLILLAGYWISQFLGRCALVWAVNEEIPAPRRLAACMRSLVLFVAVVIAADHLNLARNVFLAAFIILLAGMAITISLAVGLGAREAVRDYLLNRCLKKTDNEGEPRPDRTTWNHL